MSPLAYNRPRHLYTSYKQLDREIFAELDPLGQLGNARYEDAVRIAQVLVGKLPEERRDRLHDLLEEAIALRKECRAYFKFAPPDSQRGHNTYIEFLERILPCLMVYENNAKEVVDVKEPQQPAVDVKEQLLEREHQESEKAERADDEETEDDETALTPDQADFLDFLELLMALTRKAAALWERVARHQLPIWVASILIRMLQSEVEHLINLTRLVNEEDWERKKEPKGFLPWAAISRGGGGASQPRLAKDWVDVLDNVRDAGATWRELATLPSLLFPCIESMLLPSYEAAAEMVQADDRPYIFTVLKYGIGALPTGKDCTSVAQVPLVTLIGVYFCSLVDRDLLVGKTPKSSNLKLLLEARTAVCAEMKENLDILPRIIKYKAVTKEQAKTFRNTTKQLMAWAGACTEPMSLGEIHVFSRLHWAEWHGCIVASNSNLLQTFLYLCEMRRLQAPAIKGATAGDDDDDDKRLLNDLLEDSRIAPFLLMAGRPRTVQQCISALQKWCYVPTTDGETQTCRLELADMRQRNEIMERSCQARRVPLLSEDIKRDGYGLSKDTRARLSAKEGADDDAALERYLTWEVGGPNCLKLENALRNTLRKLPLWEDTLVNAVLLHIDKGDRKLNWQKAITKAIQSGLNAVMNRDRASFSCVIIKHLRSLATAVLKVALDVPGCHESLKSTLASSVRNVIGWEDSFTDGLLQETMPLLKALFVDFDIESLSKNPDVEYLTCIECLLPMDLSEDPDTGSSKKRKGRKGLQRQQREERREQRNKAVGEIFQGFMEEARPILEQAYGKRPGTSTGDTEGGGSDGADDDGKVTRQHRQESLICNMT